MEHRLDELSSIYEFALRRIRSFDDDTPVLSEDAMNRLAELHEKGGDYAGENAVRIAYDRGFAVCRIALAGYSFHVAGQLDYEEEDALAAAYRYINGPLMEASHELDPESDREADTTSARALRDATRDLQTFLVDTGCLPPKRQHYLDAMNVSM